MEQDVNNKIELKDKLVNFYNSNKKKIYTFIFVLIIILVSLILLKINNEKKNTLAAEKYIQAGINLNLDNKDKSKEFYEDIIYSKNSFYGILALNAILEKELVSDKEKILKYFKILTSSKLSQDQIDIINFKKALFLIKVSEKEKGDELLNNLIKNNSKFKTLAEEIIKK